ncbi:tetratricopeptide repeat protein [Desulfovibrio mangrovi]|uniref:tetratricopeptide repeat protein n=1 Tax=Desulfovibrio mangrovi TaxID=2976983 RepID=UPI002245B38E|nr:tetratricopeptide repeat protein [Desulfovibrio mangrovi]UZP67364.1 tetratricopeptide repeat protein [Desulfovibrio mangrovi]
MLKTFGICLCLIFALAGCGKSESAPLGRFNPVGTAGIYNEQAERAFAKAHVLWRGERCTDPDQAIKWLTEAITLEPEYAQAWLRRGLAYSDKGWYDLALDDLNKAVRLAPTVESYSYRGLVEMRLGNLMGAERDLTRAIDMDSNYHRAWNFRAATRLLDERITAACDDFKTGCKKGDCTGWDNAVQQGICE